MEIKFFFSKYYTNKLYIKIKCNYYYSEKKEEKEMCAIKDYRLWRYLKNQPC